MDKSLFSITGLAAFLSCFWLKEGQDSGHKNSMQVRHLYSNETTNYIVSKNTRYSKAPEVEKLVIKKMVY